MTQDDTIPPPDLDKKVIGFTTSFPVEVVFAAGHKPIDLNNIFVLNDPANLVKKAELSGFPRNICSWIKGMYAVIADARTSHPTFMGGAGRPHKCVPTNIDIVVGIVQGDCSNTHSLMDILKDEGKTILPFSYPFERNKAALEAEISGLEAYFGICREETINMKKKLDQIRRKLILLDELTWKTNQISSFENHIWLVTSSDFNGDFNKFSDELEKFLIEAQNRKPFAGDIRLGFVGVPPILDDIYSFVESCDARVVFNEVQRQFSMFYIEEDIVEQYRRFTYPYSIFERIKDIKEAIQTRNIDGILCYTQSFCHRQLDIISLKKHIDLPVLQIEGDQPGKIDERTKLRIESFLEMIRR